MLQNQTQSVESSWNQALNGIYAFYDAGSPEKHRKDMDAIVQTFASEPATAAEFIRRFHGVSDWQLDEKIYLASLLFAEYPNVTHLHLMASFLDACIGMPACFNTLLHTINHAICDGEASWDDFDADTFKRESLWPVYTKFIDTYFAELPFKADTERIDGRENRAVIVTPQMIEPMNESSRMPLEFARGLIETQGCAVLVANTEGYPQTDEAPIVQAVIAARSEETPDQLAKIDFLGTEVLTWRSNKLEFTLEKVVEAVLTLDAYDPGVVYSYGEFNLVADILARHYPVIHIPSTTSSAMSRAHVYLRPTTEEVSFPEVMTGQQGVYHAATFTPLTAQSISFLTRDELGLPSDALVFVLPAGDVDRAVSRRFLSTIKRMMKADRRVHFVVAYDHYQGEIEARLPNQFVRRIHHVPTPTDIMAFFACCDGYLNPFGASPDVHMLYAFKAGLPILTLAGVHHTGYLGDALTAADEAAYTETAIKLVTDDTYRGEIRDAIWKRSECFPTLMDKPETLSDLYELAVKQAE